MVLCADLKAERLDVGDAFDQSLQASDTDARTVYYIKLT